MIAFGEPPGKFYAQPVGFLRCDLSGPERLAHMVGDHIICTAHSSGGGNTLEEKRRTLRDSWRVHRTLGTKAAVKTAVSAIYPDSELSEWFEYGGEPYHFRLVIHTAQHPVETEKSRNVLRKIEFYKNLRSHLDEITYLSAPLKGEIGIGSSLGCGFTETPLPERPADYRMKGSRIKTGGGLAGGAMKTPLPAAE